MSANNPVHKEIRRLLWAMRDGDLISEDAAQLRTLLRDDPKAREFYVWHMFLAGSLEWDRSASTSGQWPVTSDQCNDVNDFLPESNPQSPIPNPSFIPPIVTDSSPTLHWPIGSFVFSHIAAAVILGIGLLIGLAWRISLPSPEKLAPNTLVQSVARITALADCKWTKQGSEVRGPGSGISEIQIPKSLNPQIPICLGDRLVLSSGLMQITYDTGAVVLLQGPCTYQIDSARSGYLAVGKLTALVEKKTEVSNPQSLIPNPLFAVRTPTAVVTDLGTEFGVEVEQSGATRSHVFQGKVELRENRRELTTPGAAPLILQAGESARVKRGRNNKVAITHEPGQPSRFVRQISKSPNPQTSKSSPSSLIPHPSSLAYRFTDLGTLGGRTSKSYGINIAGHVVGEAKTPDGAMHAFVYINGQMKDLGAFHGRTSCAYGINVHGQIVGHSGNHGDDFRAFLFSNGTTRDLGVLGGPSSRALDINAAGQVVGHSKNADGISRAFLYTNSARIPAEGHGTKTDWRMVDLGALGGPKASSWAYSINDAGQVAGRSVARDGFVHAFLRDPHAGMQDLGTLGGQHSWAYGISNRGQTVGYSALNENIYHAFVLTNGRMRDLGTLGGPNSIAHAINKAGQVVGGADTVEHGVATFHAFLYTDGRLIDLNSLVPRNTWTLDTATAINDSGQITGYGTAPDGNTRAFLLTPVREKRAAEK